MISTQKRWPTQKKLDCASCHNAPKEGKDGAYSFHFKDSDTKSGEELKKLYHDNCISCHVEMRSTAKRTGPVDAECRTCHDPRPKYVSDRQEIGLDKRVHYNHTASPLITYQDEKTNCGACHHVYDASAKRLEWGKNKEDSCRACHMTEDARGALLTKDANASDENGLIKDRLSLGGAVHQACVNCHFSLNSARVDENAKVLPTDCASCHSKAAVDALAEVSAQNPVDSVPRLDRGQDDSVLMLPKPEKQAELKGMMRPVSFNHKLHESKNMDCRTCHHKKIAACSTCHSYEGKADGNFVTFGQAMHKSTAKQSCIGCHNRETQKPDCAGCHIRVPAVMSQNSCAVCHTTPVGASGTEAENGTLLKLGQESRQKMGEATVAARKLGQVKIYTKDDIPETVTIGLLSNEYEPSIMPHRKIVLALWEKQRDNHLAAAFHTDDGTLCQGCHHNSPVSKTPPKCVSCHSTDVKSGPDGRLSLKAAYHQQCMTCHARMKQKPAETECADCHKPRGN